MITATLLPIFEQNLQKLIAELKLYERESDIWKVDKSIANPAGNLALHIVGNLNTYIGRELGKQDYVRNRELEFSAKDIPRISLIESINETMVMVAQSLKMLSDEDIKKEYPILVLPERTTTEYLLVHLVSHLSYHLGQVNYHRRMIQNNT